MDVTAATLLGKVGLTTEPYIVLPSPPGVEVICAVAMPEERSFDRWQEADHRAQECGYVALGVGTRNAVDRLMEDLDRLENWNMQYAVQAALSFDLQRWFADREEELIEDSGELPLGTWKDPKGPPGGGFWFPFEKGVHLDPWWMVLVPADERWKAPLSLAYGNWNDCPDAEVHAAVCRRWQATHGASLVAASPDTVEFLVEAPPQTRQAALELAREQYLYCTDIVDQGIGTISALAASLIGNGVWSFWWD